MLTYRAGAILRAIVEHYITKVTPASSQSIINDYDLGVSSATVRNEMAQLEQEKYISRPHTSAGSVPLDSGYRYYVEALEDVQLPQAEQRLVDHLFHQVEGDLEEWLNLAATVISQLTQNVAVVTMPKPEYCQYRHMELVFLHDSLVLLVLVLRNAKARQQLITISEDISQDELSTVAKKLNSIYSGLSSKKIKVKGKNLSPVEQQVTDCLLEIMKAEDAQEYEHPYLDGLHFMLNQPEFAKNYRILNLMELVEQRNLLKNIIPSGLDSPGVRVIIGKENKAEVVHDYSVVVSRYGLNQDAVGTISVVGPTRMSYARAISTVDYISSVLGRLVAELYGKNPGDAVPADTIEMADGGDN
ncbi:heat-inducible transcriptional repressor HrcA [Chloroflexota bacterium]